MARRKEFKAIAEGLLSSFISRNNDVNGYWGIGKLFSLMLREETLIIEIDLINKIIIPQDKEFNNLVEDYSNRLRIQVDNRKLNRTYLKKAKIILIGYPNRPKISLGQIAPNRIDCKLTITDDLDRKHEIEKQVWCREHDPKRELRSTRYNEKTET